MPVARIAAIILLVVFAVVANTAPAPAQSCSFTNTGVNFGTINLVANTTFDATGTLTANCTGTAGNTVTVCPSFNAGSGGVNGTGATRYMLGGTNQLQYNIYSDSAHTTVWGSYTWGLPPTPPTMSVALSGSGSGSSNHTLYGQVFAGQTTLPQGAYVSDFSGNQTHVSYAYSTVGNCAAIGLTNVTHVPFLVQANYGSACFVTTTTLNFGTRGILSSAIDAANAISVTCTSGVAYTVGLNGGNQGASDPTQRKMANGGNTAFVTYGIYRDSARTLPWGNTIGTNTASGTGNGNVQNFRGQGRVPAQTTPAPTTYTDTVVVTVTY